MHNDRFRLTNTAVLVIFQYVTNCRLINWTEEERIDEVVDGDVESFFLLRSLNTQWWEVSYDLIVPVKMRQDWHVVYGATAVPPPSLLNQLPHRTMISVKPNDEIFDYLSFKYLEEAVVSVLVLQGFCPTLPTTMDLSMTKIRSLDVISCRNLNLLLPKNVQKLALLESESCPLDTEAIGELRFLSDLRLSGVTWLGDSNLDLRGCTDFRRLSLSNVYLSSVRLPRKGELDLLEGAKVDYYEGTLRTCITTEV